MLNSDLPDAARRRFGLFPAYRFSPARSIPLSPVVHLHEDGEPHFHEYSEEERKAIAILLWKTDNVELITVGIDIASSTSHLMFARVHLQRKTQMLSSGYVVVDRKVLWKSPILLTPFLPDNSIDAGRLKEFIDGAYRPPACRAKTSPAGP
jgi:ethanolamine utilization protein EutA